MLLLLKNIFFTLLMPGTIAVYLPLWIANIEPKRLVFDGSYNDFAASFLVLFGVIIYFWCLWDFATFGRGTPAPIDAPKRLIVRGLYHFTRNPMYIGVLMVIAGWALFFGSWNIVGYGIIVGICFHIFILLVEEPILRKKFGDSYEHYCEQVSRWLPGFR